MSSMRPGLPPLLIDGPQGRGPHRVVQPTAGMTSVGPRSLPKVYPRLQTLTQLTDKYVRTLHTRGFVSRSKMRWQNISGVDAPNSARDRTINTVKFSAALVIQCSWRKHAAQMTRERLKTAVWRHQLEIAAKITRDSSRLTQALVVMEKQHPEKRSFQVLSSIIPIHGLYFNAPAQLIAWWLEFTCTLLLAKRILRHPPAVVSAVYIPVKLTRRKLASLWRCVVPFAVLMIQCSFRAFLARCEVGKRKLERRQLKAAARLQGFIRVFNAQHIAKRLRRWCAATSIQCLWRCHRARECLQQRRITWAATSICTPLILEAAKQATLYLRVKSAKVIQKHYRGCHARAQFRELVSRHEQQRWRQNPSKGFDFFDRQRYDHAALYLENCFRQGIFAEEVLPTSQSVLEGNTLAAITPNRKLVSGSRMSFSFSTIPTKLGTDWVLQNDNFRTADDSSSEAARLAGRLQFWQAYAISHFKVFEASGNVLNLTQACVGWESYLQVDAVAQTWPSFHVVLDALNDLRLRSQFALVRCWFWSGKPNESVKALSLSLRLLQEISARHVDALNSKLTTSHDVPNDEAHLLMFSSMIFFEQGQFDKSCAQLEKLLNKPSQTAFTDLEIRFTLALILMKRFEKNCRTSCRELTLDDPETNAHLRTATQLLKQCYRVIEMWPAVGFYHGRLRKSDAKRLLETQQVGAFLLHHSAEKKGVDPNALKHDNSEKVLLQVKLSDYPFRVASLRIEFTGAEVYKTNKMATHLGKFSLHGLVAHLPPESGIQMELGIRKSLYTASLEKKLEQSQPELLKEKTTMRSRLLDWDEWERKVNETAALRFSKEAGRWNRRNETWSAVCFEIAKALEYSEAWVFARLAAQEALLHSKDRLHRATVSFLAARVALNTQRRNESALFVQQAHLEMPLKHPRLSRCLFIANLTAVHRALSLSVSLSKQEPFVCRLERVQKLERLCLKAWRYDSLAARFCGDSFREALLLQRIADETFFECGDTFFFRSLLKAHVRAYVVKKWWHENLHLKCAYACVARLFDRFHTHQESWAAVLASLKIHLEEKLTPKWTLLKKRTFSVKLLLLSWHHMPFLVCFEMAEVLYRYKNKGHSVSTLIEVYESLLGRLRGSQAHTLTYVSYEELILFRMSFLHLAKVSQSEHSWRHLDAAMISINEILEQRRNRNRVFTPESVLKKAKKILWPCSIQFPFHFTDSEVLFIRGYFAQLQEDMMQIPLERRRCWRDYHPLHQDLMSLVTASAPPGELCGSDGRMLNSVRYRAENLRGLKIFVGSTHDVAIPNVLLSQPFVAIRHEGNMTLTQAPPTWTNLSPSWEEDIEIPVFSSRANITINVMNHTRRHAQWQDADTIGYVSILMHDLLAAHDGITEGKYYELTLVKAPIQRPSSESEGHRDKVARIFLSFQVIVKPQPMLPPSAKRTATWATQSGNWDLEDVRTYLHGDLQIFVSSRWIWSRFASMLKQDNDFFVAKWFFGKSVRLTSELQRRSSKIGIRLNTTDSLDIVRDLLGLSCCYRAILNGLTWGEQAIPLLGQAEAILKRKATPHKREYCSIADHATIEKQLTVVRDLLADARATLRRIGPLEEALSRKTPATSEWVKLTNRKPSGGISTRYFNQDTGEVFKSDWRVEPLEYEDMETVILEEQERLPHRIVIMNSDMKARVNFFRQELLRLHADDPFQWVAVFNDRIQEMQFFSPYSPEAYSSSRSSKYPSRPPTYVMLADEFLLYHVLLVQDAFRKYRCRRQRQRRIRGTLMSVYLISRGLISTQQRILLRSLNCVRVVVVKAEHLRAGDLLTSDPFVVVALADPLGEVVATGETSVRYNSLNPKWNEEFCFRYSFTEHEVQQQLAAASLNENSTRGCGAVLILKVLDYDVVSTRKVDGKKLNEGEKNKEYPDKEHYTAQQKYSGDFLGMVTIPIQNFIHGKHTTADLPLFDANGEDNSPRARGSLTVSIQWTHSIEKDEKVSNATKLWAVGSGRGRALITKKAKDRSELPAEASREIDQLHKQMEQLLQLLLTVANEVLDPMNRLQKRMENAQTKGKTAEEAKMLEQRLISLLHTQLLPKSKVMRDLIADHIDCQLPTVLKKLFGPIEEYISSFDQSSRRQLRLQVEKCLDELNATMYSLKLEPAEDITHGDAMIMALDQHHHVNVWNDQFRQILETFFIGENAQWHFSLEEKVGEVYWKLAEGRGARE